MTPQDEYTVPLSSDNAVVLFIDNQINLMLGTQSIDTTLLRTNTEALAKLASIYDLPVVLTMSNGEHGLSGPLITPITDTFPDLPVIDRQDYLNAMADSRFSDAVIAARRRKVILCGLTTDVSLLYPTASLIDQGYHVFIVVDASGSWTSAINDAALQRVTQMGATLTNVQSIAGELQNAAAVKDPATSRQKRPLTLEWLRRYTAAPALVEMGSHR